MAQPNRIKLTGEEAQAYIQRVEAYLGESSQALRDWLAAHRHYKHRIDFVRELGIEEKQFSTAKNVIAGRALCMSEEVMFRIFMLTRLPQFAPSVIPATYHFNKYGTVTVYPRQWTPEQLAFEEVKQSAETIRESEAPGISDDRSYVSAGMQRMLEMQQKQAEQIAELTRQIDGLTARRKAAAKRTRDPFREILDAIEQMEPLSEDRLGVYMRRFESHLKDTLGRLLTERFQALENALREQRPRQGGGEQDLTNISATVQSIFRMLRAMEDRERI